MEWNIKTIGIVLAIFFIGYIIGLVEAAIKQKNKDKKNLQFEKKSEELPPAGFKLPNLFSINRNDSNDIILELEGQTISNKDELTPENKRSIMNLLTEVRPWLLTTAPPPTQQQAEPKPEPLMSKPKISSEANPPLAASSSKKSEPVPTSESIVSQVDKVLQNRLSSSSLANQGIRLQESPTGGVRVYVGLNRYDGIDAIPDPEIQEFIRQAVAEWEGRS